MRRLLFLIIFFPNFFSFSQSVISPEIDYITVNQATSLPVIYWSHPDISQINGYAVKRFIQSFPTVPDNTWHTIKRIDNPNILNFEDNTSIYGNARPNIQSEIYEITAYKVSGTDTTYSLPSNSHKTIFLNGNFNYCPHSVSLFWNNYIGWNNSFNKYEIYESVNNGTYFKISETLYNDTIFNVLNLNFNTNYKFYIKAVRNDGTESLSNVFELNTPLQILPAFFKISKVETNNNEILINYLYDTNISVNRFALYKKTSSENSFSEILTKNYLPDNLMFTVKDVNVEEVNKFFIAAIDSCERIISRSDTVSNIALSLKKSESDKTIFLNWNDIFFDKKYKIFRKYKNDFQLTKETNEHNFSDDINSLLNDQFNISVSGGEICYFVKIDESNFVNISNIKCSKQKETIIFPNAFNPNSSVIENRVFKPKAAFISDFRMTVYGPFGDIIFESSNPDFGWDGRLKNGQLAPASSYLYYATYKNAFGIIRKIKNYVTLVY